MSWSSAVGLPHRDTLEQDKEEDKEEEDKEEENDKKVCVRVTFEPFYVWVRRRAKRRRSRRRGGETVH